jgi:hypothetical protein
LVQNVSLITKLVRVPPASLKAESFSGNATAEELENFSEPFW